ncbi:hypothetical protein H5410_052322, partial [Solanum commersonii]
ELIVMLLARLDIARSSVLTSSSPVIVDVEPRVQGPSMGFHTLGSFSVPFIAPPRFAAPTISSSATIIPIEFEQIHMLVKWFTGYLQKVTTSLMVVELRDFIVRVSSWVIHLKVKIIQGTNGVGGPRPSHTSKGMHNGSSSQREHTYSSGHSQRSGSHDARSVLALTVRGILESARGGTNGTKCGDPIARDGFSLVVI